MAGEISLTPEAHILCVNLMTWGHSVASLNLVSKIVRWKPVYVTVAVGDPLYDKTVVVLDGLFTKGDAAEDALRALIRVTGIQWPNFLDEVEPAANYKAIFKYSYEMTPIPLRPGSTDVLPVVPRARLVIADFFMPKTMRAIREVAGFSVKVYAMQSCCVASLLQFGPKEEGKPGAGDLSKVVATIMAEGLETDVAYAKMDKAYRRQDGVVLDIAGLPPVYDHELQPQKSIFHFSMANWAQWAHSFFMECDGVIHGTSLILEKDAVAECARIFHHAPENTVCAGPFSFPLKLISWDINAPSTPEARDLLDRALKENGPNSVVYMSLGTKNWITESEKIWAIISMLLDKGIYLLFSHATTFEVIPEDLEARLEASETAFASAWMSQTQILQHEACGWFITHCGENSYCESLAAGVPVICFPIDADQPYNAVYATDVHRVGYELYNARNGAGLGPIHRKDGWTPEGSVEALKEEFEEVLKKAFGEDGEAKRVNARAYKGLLKDSWKEGGDSWKEIDKLFKYAI